MNDEQKSKQELIDEIKALRQKYSELKRAFLDLQNLKNADATGTILVVDDNKETRLTILEMLDLLGYKVFEAKSSEKAIELFRSHKTSIDLVLSDVVMPEINGPQLVDKLVKLKPNVKIVFMSGYAEKDIIHSEVDKVIKSNFVFIEKPFSLSKLTKVISLQLNKNIGIEGNDC